MKFHFITHDKFIVLLYIYMLRGGKPQPVDINLYNSIKKKVYKDIPKHSAYRSGILVQKYKDAFKKKYGSKSPYSGKKNTNKGLGRWFKEKWVNQRGEIGYKNKNDIYRPTYIITDDTPTTHAEISKKELDRARKEKGDKGRVKKFKRKKPRKKIKRKKQMGGSKTRKPGVEGKPGTVILFEDHKDFRPNLTPSEIFKLGSFGGTYWRPIKSSVTGKKYKDMHKKYPKEWWEGVDKLTTPFSKYDKKINKYGVQVGTTLEFWEEKNWITKYHPYGWVHWYCDFYMGKRCPDDKRQIMRWKGVAGSNGRFLKWLATLIKKKNGEWDDETISPKIRQTLQHWAYMPTKKDMDKHMKS